MLARQKIKNILWWNSNILVLTPYQVIVILQMFEFKAFVTVSKQAPCLFFFFKKATCIVNNTLFSNVTKQFTVISRWLFSNWCTLVLAIWEPYTMALLNFCRNMQSCIFIKPYQKSGVDVLLLYLLSFNITTIKKTSRYLEVSHITS